MLENTRDGIISNSKLAPQLFETKRHLFSGNRGIQRIRVSLDILGIGGFTSIALYGFRVEVQQPDRNDTAVDIVFCSCSWSTI